MRRFAVITLAALSVATATGCGATKAVESAKQAIDPVAQAAVQTAGQDSARITLSATTEVDGKSIKLTGGGVGRFKPALVGLTVRGSAAGQDIEVKEILSGTTIYVQPSGAKLPSGKSWLKIDLGKVSPGLSSAMGASGSDPTQQIKLLEAMSNAKPVGQETIDGRATTHYHGTLDYARLARSGPVAERALAAQAAKLSGQAQTPVDVWVDEGRLIRRETLSMVTKPVGAAPAVRERETIEFPEYGVDTSSVQVPAVADTDDETAAAAAQLKQAGG